jgi:hypothetical protein
MTNACISLRNSKGRQALRRPRHRWKSNIKIDHRKVGYESLEWIHLVKDRHHNISIVMDVWVP